jgi:hypothetical protein
MPCQRCKSDRILEICIKNHGDFAAYFKEAKVTDSSNLEGIYFGGYTEPKICLECGQVQGKFPMMNPKCDPEDTTQPSHTDAVKMLSDIMSARYQNILLADDPKHRFYGFSCYNTNKEGEEIDAAYYTIPIMYWKKLSTTHSKLNRFIKGRYKHGSLQLTEELKNNQNFNEWYENL